MEITPGLGKRGAMSPRCAVCCLAPQNCVCALTPTLKTPAQFWILIHPEERRKPTNTARLIRATLPHTRLFLWHRTTPPAGFVPLLQDPQFAPVLLFPQGETASQEPAPLGVSRLYSAQRPPSQTEPAPAFVLLDGTWSQARKMLTHSAYVRGIPRLSLQPSAPSTYTLRRQRCGQYLSTVEVAIALLHAVGSTEAGTLLQAYFRVFTASCLASRHGHALRTTLPEMETLRAYNARHAQTTLGPVP